MIAVKAGDSYWEGQRGGRPRHRPREMAIRKTTLPETAWILARGDGSPGMPVFIGLQTDAETTCGSDWCTKRVAREEMNDQWKEAA